MTTQSTLQAAEEIPFIPIALEEEDIAAYASMAEALGCSLETCAEGFMLATPAARDTAAQLWGCLVRLREARPLPPEARALRDVQIHEGVEALRSLIGLNPDVMSTATLAAAGLRYRA
ncbi:polysaccharide deacetylase [Roseomonas sp. GC11]|uniref:polysaccharide deacetylase n=1 Tax=Roseomonas sp. GC11 TaxID=2950546 RepID=UPI00210AD14F|nr:polysaccharide deacetylase [Roseomonas sp. GC11]MCQ4159924.1 polysaccharide deacetylase [Roseomonas sp. GC11]